MSPNPKEPVPALRPYEIGSPSYKNKLSDQIPKSGPIESEGTQESKKGNEDSKKSN